MRRSMLFGRVWKSLEELETQRHRGHGEKNERGEGEKKEREREGEKEREREGERRIWRLGFGGVF